VRRCKKKHGGLRGTLLTTFFFFFFCVFFFFVFFFFFFFFCQIGESFLRNVWLSSDAQFVAFIFVKTINRKCEVFDVVELTELTDSFYFIIALGGGSGIGFCDF
jgi:hypothetical protein